MKRTLQPLFLLLIGLIYSNSTLATIFTAVDDGDWDETTTWDQGSVPGILDTVVINGYRVTIDINSGNVIVKQIILTNTVNDDRSSLKINGLVTVNVLDDLEATLENLEGDIEVSVLNGAILNVLGNVDFMRSAANSLNKKLLLTIEDASRMNVIGDFTFDYKNADINENYHEIFLDNTAILDITGNIYLYIRGGNDFDFKIQGSSQAILRGNLYAQISGGDEMTITTTGNSHFQVMGNVSVTNSGGTSHAMLHAAGSSGTFTIGGILTMNSTAADKIVYLEATNSNCVIDVAGDISLSALSEGDVYIDLKESSNMYIGGNFLRPTNFGALLMNQSATLTYNGAQSQVFGNENLTGSGADAFHFTNVVLNNASGFVLEDTMFITNNLDLENGKIKTTPTNILIIGDQADITGGSASNFVDGPMIKEGRSIGDEFVFPLGDGSRYAPLEISEISTSSSRYMAQYFSDPPPFGNNIGPNVNSISSNQYWTLYKFPGSEDVNVVLHWMDAAASNIFDLESLIVVGLNEANVWENYGNGGTTGDTGNGASGSVATGQGDPPPFGVEKYTIGRSSDVVTAVEVTFNNKIQVLSIYPNPVDKVLQFKGEDSITDEGILEVFGINGHRIYSGKYVLENGRFQISTNEIKVFTSGTYIVRFTSASGSHVMKFNKL